MGTIISFIFFLLIILVCIYFPGRLLLRRIKFSTHSAVAALTLSLGAGIALFLGITYFLAWIHMTVLYLVFAIGISVIEISLTISQLKKNIHLKSVLSFESLILLSGVIFMMSGVVDSGWITNGNIYFHGTNALDGIFHIALINSMVFQFPPSYPGLSGTILQGYHVLYDFLLSQFVFLFKFSPYDIYFRFFTLFVAVFYGISGLTLAHTMKMDTLTRRVFLFLLFFGQGIELFIFYWSGTYRLYDSGIQQPIWNIVDPSVLFSISFVFLFVSILAMRPRGKQILLPILFLGLVPGIKIYTGILTYVAFGILALYQLLQKDFKYLAILICAGIISAIVYLPFNIGAGHLIFNPFLSMRHFMEGDKILASFQWVLKLQFYTQVHNIPRIIYLYILASLFYFIPPLGIRLVSLVKIRSLFHKGFYTVPNTFFLVFMLVGFLFPLFFIQSVAVFNTVQFYWVVWIVLLIPTAFSSVYVIGKPTRLKTILLFLMLIILAVPAFSFPYLIHTTTTLVIPKDLDDFTKTVKRFVPPKAVILVVNRENKNGLFEPIYQVPLFGALLGKPMYYEPEQGEFSEIQEIETSRKKVVESVSVALDHCDSSLYSQLLHSHIHYLITLRTNVCNLTSGNITALFTKGSYTLYKAL